MAHKIPLLWKHIWAISQKSHFPTGQELRWHIPLCAILLYASLYIKSEKKTFHHPFPEVCIPMSVIRFISAAFCISKNMHNSAKSEESIKKHDTFQAFALITGKYIVNYMGSKQSLSHTNI